MTSSRRCAAAVLAAASLVFPGCARSTAVVADSPGRMVATGHGIELPFTQSTTSTKSLPATALFSAGPYDLSAKLKAHGMTAIGEDTPVWIDGTRHFGLEALAGLTIEDIARVDVVRGVWSGLSGNPLAPRDEISITTRRALAAAKQ